MNKIILLLIFAFLSASSQELKFDKRFVQSEDKWVAFPPDSTNSYSFGFIYVDAQAGLTLDYVGSFTIDEKGAFIYKPKEVAGAMKYRLQPNNATVAHIPNSKLADLKVSVVPDWLQIYKEGENTIERLYKWGYMYNGWSECEKALEFLEKAAKLDPKYKGLAVELAFSYNCLKRHTEAITVLKTALQSTPTDSYVSKEYIYALSKNNQLDEAKNIYKKSHKANNDKTYQVENAFNILQGYFLNKDVKNFESWLIETENLYLSHQQIADIVKQMKLEIRK
jgi:tetratricopeptide (TPR) repeat protein